MGKLTGESSIEIDAPIDEVYAVVEDVLTAADWQGGMRRMDLVERDAEGRAAVVDAVADGKVTEFTSRQQFTYEPPTALRWTQLKGNVKNITGAWELEDLGDGRTRATYHLEVDPGRVLGLTVRGPVEATLRALLVNARAGELKTRIEG
jgi:ribosome-associated toxin RatA of RatAB toxin-antitoxin module